MRKGSARASPAPRGAGPERNLRRGVRAFAFRSLAALVAVLMPLHGITGVMAAYQAPAHYHLPATSSDSGAEAVPLQALAAVDDSMLTRIALRRAHAAHAHDATHSHDPLPIQPERAPSHAPASPAHRHGAGTHVHVAPKHSHLSPPPRTARQSTAAADQAAPVIKAAPAGTKAQRTLGPRHAHAYADAGVVYLEGKPDHSEGRAPGRFAAPAADAALPGWWMTLLGPMGAPSLPQVNCRYRSHLASPALRPPAAAIALTA